MSSEVDAFFAQVVAWKEEFTALRAILGACGLTEELKWGWPCYTVEGRNVVLMHGFKEYCAVLFPQGALLRDERGVLIIQTENVQAARQIRFISVADIAALKDVLPEYVREAAANELQGRKVVLKKTSEFPMPEEFLRRLDDDPLLQEAFAALTPGRQRAYLLHFGQAKQSATREARIDKAVPRILEGKGLLD